MNVKGRVIIILAWSILKVLHPLLPASLTIIAILSGVSTIPFLLTTRGTIPQMVRTTSDY